MMKIITGYIPQTKGDVWVNDLNTLENSLEIRKTIGYLPENNPLYVLQFIRYAPMVRARCARVVVLCPPSLAPLLGTVAGVDAVVSDRRHLPAFGCQVPLLSLPRVFGTMLETIPGTVPYLVPDPVRIAARRDSAAADGPGVRVGLAWRGNPQHPNDRNRSLTASAVASLCQIPGTIWFSLQQELTAAEREAFTACGAFHDLGPTLSDWAETAAVIATLDLVVTVDTAVAHLAGALARPVYLLLPFAPDWRWLLERGDSPWYPTMHLYRQPSPGDWDSVLRQIVQDLTTTATP